MTMTTKSKPKHFENLWELAESCYDSASIDNISAFNELNLKIGLLKAIVDNDSIPETEKTKAIEYSYGEILMTMTQLSLKLNINSYKALSIAISKK